MSYCLKPRRSVASEVKRIIDKQLSLAIDELRTIGDRRSDGRIHEARRHVKKVRAILRLVQPVLGDTCHGVNRRLGTANRMLGPIADGGAVVDTIAQLGGKYRARPAQRTLHSLQAALVQRAERVDRRAELERVLPVVAGILRREQRRLTDWTLTARGFDAVGPGLEKSMRCARNAMKRSLRHPASDNYHVWRRRVKDLWFQVRLLEARCGGALIDDQRRLEALDGCLGESHNVVLLEEILITEALVPRQQAAGGLRLLRRYRAELRNRAASLGRAVFAEKPAHFVRRVKRLWHTPRAARKAGAKEGRRWPRAA
jgi:CHAD domain-containing protein